jgi:hypothetical protein
MAGYERQQQRPEAFIIAEWKRESSRLRIHHSSLSLHVKLQQVVPPIAGARAPHHLRHGESCLEQRQTTSTPGFADALTRPLDVTS